MGIKDSPARKPTILGIYAQETFAVVLLGLAPGYTVKSLKMISATCHTLVSDLFYYLHTETIKDEWTQNKTRKFTRKIPWVLIYRKLSTTKYIII